MQANKAIVGRNAFAHEAGIHQDGMLKDRRTYEIMRAEDVGAPWNPLVLGKHSGRHAVQAALQRPGLELEAGELVEVYRALMAIADDRKILTDSDVVAVVSAVRTGSVTAHEPVDPFDTPSGVAAAHHPNRLRARRVGKSQIPNPKLQIPNDRRNCSRLGIWDLGFGVWDFPQVTIIRPVGGAMPRSANTFAIRFRSSRPTSHCFSGTVLMRPFTTSCVAWNASMPRPRAAPGCAA